VRTGPDLAAGSMCAQIYHCLRFAGLGVLASSVWNADLYPVPIGAFGGSPCRPAVRLVRQESASTLGDNPRVCRLMQLMQATAKYLGAARICHGGQSGLGQDIAPLLADPRWTTMFMMAIA